MKFTIYGYKGSRGDHHVHVVTDKKRANPRPRGMWINGTSDGGDRLWGSRSGDTPSEALARAFEGIADLIRKAGIEYPTGRERVEIELPEGIQLCGHCGQPEETRDVVEVSV